MKTIISMLVLMVGFASFSQDKEPCSQLPQAKPDATASVSGDMNKHFSGVLSDDLKKDGATFEATFKMIVDCNGDVAKIMFMKGDISDADQKLFIQAIEKLDWKPAQKGDKDVTSTVFIVLNITNGQVKATLY